MRVLLVEGDPRRLAGLQHHAVDLGFDVLVADDADEAWRLFQAEVPALVVLADDLPSMGGGDLCRRIRAVSGGQVYVLLLTSVTDPDHLSLLLQAGADDILLRTRAEDEIRLRLSIGRMRLESQSRARATARSLRTELVPAPDLIQTVSLDGAVLYTNRAWCECLGYREDEVRSLPFFDFIAPEVRPAFLKAFRWVKRGRGIRYMQTELLTRGGEVVSVEGSLTPRFRGKNPTSVRVILRDTSRRRRTETVLHSVLEGTSATTGAAFFRSLVEHLSAALEVRHALVGELLPGSPTRLRTLAVWEGDAFGAERDFELEEIPRRGESEAAGFFPGARFLAEVGAESYLGVPLIGASGQVIGLLCVLDGQRVRAGPSALRILSTFAQRAGAELQRLRVEAERRELDRRMQETQKLESLGVLAGGIAHDFNNLLTSIMGYASLARQFLPPGAPSSAHLESIETASRRAAELATQMLAYSGKGSFVIESLDLRDVVRETVGFLGTDTNQRGVRLELELPDEFPSVEGDPTQVRQVLMNLLLNAAQAMGPEGGIVHTRLQVVPLVREELVDCYVGADLPEGQYVSVVIRDSGCGMEADTARCIFDPFFTTKESGRGLGLAAVVGIMRGHRGALRVQTAPGVGTTMTVYFPASDKPVATQGSRTVEQPEQGDGLVLVVDDEDSVRTLTAEILRSGGYRVLMAANGQEGVDRLRENADAIGAVLLDMTMPVMGGGEAFRRMREIRPDLPVVLSSGYTECEAVDRLRGQVPSDFIQKPYTTTQLLEVVGRAMAGRGARA